jgi:uncharacterized repeat protein (TIGR03803 family)
MNKSIQRATLSLLFLILPGVARVGAQTLTSIHDFGSGNDGENPQAGMVFDQAGNLYGTAALGAQNGNGVVFSLTPDGGTGFTEVILHKFTGPPDGSVPVSPVVLTAPGRLFGTTLEGGANDMGSAFEIRFGTNTEAPARERVLYSFGSFNGDGIHPNAALLPAGQEFFGVTRDGGATGRGTVFQLTPPRSGGNWTETVLYSFTGSGDAAFPSSDLVMDKAGNLYGTTLVGGVNDLGAVYQLSPPANEGDTWTETVIFSFSGSDGTLPFGGLQFDQNGLLYGTTSGGGDFQGGTVFQLTPPDQPGNSWIESVLYSFTGGRDGGSPVAGVIIDKKGQLFGAASTGGSGGPDFGGVIFKLTPPQNQGDPWTETVLHSFGGPDGFRSLARLARRENGLYGTTSAGGLNGTGTAFLLIP